MIQYDPHEWFEHFFDIRGSMVQEIIGRVGVCVLWSALVTGFMHAMHYQGGTPVVHTILGTAIGLLLVFRTNASYDRFWEGRRLWGSIVNESRNLARSARAYLASDPVLMRQVIRWAAAFPYAAMHALRDRDGVGPPGSRLPEPDVAAALAANHTPLEVATRVSERLVEARDRGVISDILLVELDRNVQQLIDFIGGCERIHRTPLPFAYMVHLRRTLILYCYSLPFALIKDFGWGTVLVTLLVSYVFFGIEEIGVEIEDPFGEDDNDLPLETICGTIESNLMALVGDDGQTELTSDRSGPSAR